MLAMNIVTCVCRKLELARYTSASCCARWMRVGILCRCTHLGRNYRALPVLSMLTRWVALCRGNEDKNQFTFFSLDWLPSVADRQVSGGNSIIVAWEKGVRYLYCCWVTETGLYVKECFRHEYAEHVSRDTTALNACVYSTPPSGSGKSNGQTEGVLT